MTLPEIEFREGEQGHLVLVPTPAYKTSGDFDLVDGKVKRVDEPALMFGCIARYRRNSLRGQKTGVIRWRQCSLQLPRKDDSAVVSILAFGKTLARRNASTGSIVADDLFVLQLQMPQ